MDWPATAGDPTDDGSGTDLNNDLNQLMLAHLSGPAIVKSFESSERHNEGGVMLSNIPWAMSVGRKRRRDGSIPRYSYLDLRLSQNAAWATNQLQRGVEHARRAQAIQDEMHSVTEASAREYRKAEQCYRDGLDLVPSHPELLVALGALCANFGERYDEAADLLTKAVEVTSEDTCTGSSEAMMDKASSVGSNARKYLNEVLRRLGRGAGGINTKEADVRLTHPKSGSMEMQRKLSSASKGGEARAEKAYLDAITEHAFLSGDTSALKGVAARKSDGEGSSKYELLAEPSSEDEGELCKKISNGERYQRRRKKKKHRSSREIRHRGKKRSSRKHKKRKQSKRKRRYSGSGSESSNVSSSKDYPSSDEESNSTDSASTRSRPKSRSRKKKRKNTGKTRRKDLDLHAPLQEGGNSDDESRSTGKSGKTQKERRENA